jgi:hypothetical protein
MSLVASLVHHLPPLTGGGFWAAFAQVALVYYGFAAAIHWLIPGLFEVESVQVGERRPGQVRREALLSIGEREGFRVFFSNVVRPHLRIVFRPRPSSSVVFTPLPLLLLCEREQTRAPGKRARVCRIHFLTREEKSKK